MAEAPRFDRPTSCLRHGDFAPSRPRGTSYEPGRQALGARLRKNCAGAQEKACHQSKCAYLGIAQIARACGRVSVGGDPDKRPVNHPSEKTGSRRRTGELRFRGGSRLKATTDRAFSSLSALQRSAYRRGLSFLPGVRTGSNPLPNDGYPDDRHARHAHCCLRWIADGASPDRCRAA